MLRGISTVTYTTDDLQAAKTWYTELLGLEPYYDTPAYIEFRIGDRNTELGLLDRGFLGQLGAGTHSTAPGGTVAYWHVDDIEATLNRLTAMGATIHHPLRDFGGGGFVGASVLDPFGNVLAVMHNPHYLEML